MDRLMSMQARLSRCIWCIILNERNNVQLPTCIRVRSHFGPRPFSKSLVTSGMSMHSAAHLEQRYGAQLRQAPFSGASTTRILFRMIEQHLPRCKVNEGIT